MDGNTTDRLSQKSEPRNAKVNSILEDAAEVAGRVLSSIQALAGTTACKRVQIARLKEWAVNNRFPYRNGRRILFQWIFRHIRCLTQQCPYGN